APNSGMLLQGRLSGRPCFSGRLDMIQAPEKKSPPRRMANVPFPPAKYGLWLAITIIGVIVALMLTGVVVV
ncbi:MAG TPA: hypothetical protein DCX78_06520, partial [Nitrospina sp.]|nr:hypothetical protein [Nitrospina sp.]